MTNEIPKRENVNGHESYEHQDLQPSSILYFLLALAVVTVICLFALKGLYGFLDRREKASQPDVNPLVTNVPPDTRHVARGYPQAVFPSPKLEEDERTQLNGILTDEEKTLYSYGWVDEKAGVVRIPIERAMDLIVQRGLPVLSQSAANGPPPSAASVKRKTEKNKGEKQ